MLREKTYKYERQCSPCQDMADCRASIAANIAVLLNNVPIDRRDAPLKLKTLRGVTQLSISDIDAEKKE